jgi:hypothetical protein
MSEGEETEPESAGTPFLDADLPAVSSPKAAAEIPASWL